VSQAIHIAPSGAEDGSQWSAKRSHWNRSREIVRVLQGTRGLAGLDYFGAARPVAACFALATGYHLPPLAR